MRLSLLLLGSLLALNPLRSQVVCSSDSGKPRSAALALFASIPEDTLEPADLRRARGTLLQEYVALFQRPTDVVKLQANAERIVEHAGSVFVPGQLALSELRFTVNADGRSTDGLLTRSTADPALDAALLRTVARLDSSRVGFYTTDGRDTLQLRIELGFDPSAGLYPMPLVRLSPLGTITKPAHVLTTDAQLDVPMDFWKKKIEDTVVVQVLVGEGGRAVMDSVRVVQGKQPVYIKAILAALPKYRWSPAQAGDCAVKQWVQMPFNFHFPTSRH